MLTSNFRLVTRPSLRSVTFISKFNEKNVFLENKQRIIYDHEVGLSRTLTSLCVNLYQNQPDQHQHNLQNHWHSFTIRQYSTFPEKNPRKKFNFKQRFLKYVFSIVFISVSFGSVIYEIKWLKRKFKETVPDYVADIGERGPIKYIYVLDDSPWYFRHFPWMSSCEARIWPYISDTKGENPSIREQAIRNLVCLQGLSDTECITIASAIDFKTATALAHAGAKPAMVSRPTFLHPEKKNMCLATKFREILTALPPDSIHEVMLNTCFAALKTYHPTDAEKLDHHLSGFHHEFDSLLPLRTISEESFLRPCLQALLSHSRIKEQVPVMLEHGAMDLILVISQKYKNDYDIMGLIVKILSNFTCDPESDASIEESGLLAELAGSDDIRLSFPARKALHNLDRETSKYMLPPGIYQVYPDYRSIQDEFKVDVIFVHGVMGGAFRTWRSQDLNAIWRIKKTDENKETQCEVKLAETKVGVIRQKILNAGQTETNVPEKDTQPVERIGFRELVKRRLKSIPKKILAPPEESVIPQNREIRNGEMYFFPPHEEIPVELELLPASPRTKCWPRDWLPLDLDNIRVICTDLDTFITHWSPVMPVESLGRTISERSHELINKLAIAGVGKERPIVWICHSAGGVIVKHVLELSEKSSDEDLKNLSKMTKGVVFCSTPHFGSKILGGVGKKGNSILLPTVEILELTQGSEELSRIDDVFKDLIKKYSYQVLSFGELCPTFGSVGISRKLVSVESSDPGYGEFFALRVDHLNICKPRSRQSFLYVKIQDFIKNIMENVCGTDEEGIENR